MKQIIHHTTLLLLWSALCYGQSVTTNTATANSQVTCPDLAIQLKAPIGNNTFYAISYCNMGDAVAEDSYLELHLDSDLSIAQATHPLLYRSEATYRFLIGDIGVGECGSMYFQIPQSLVKTHCLQVFAATALPCSAQAAALRTNTTYGGGTPPNQTTGVQLMQQADVDLTRVGGQTFTDPIFEDHVFLDYVPTWDSLLRMFDDLQTYPIGDSASAGTAHVVVMPIGDDLPVHATGSYCRTSAATNRDTRTWNSGAVLTNNSNTANEPNTNLAIPTTASSSLAVKEIKMYPNPVQQVATIEAKGYETTTLQLEVFSAVGQRVHYQESQHGRFEISVQQWNQGLYYYRLLSNGTVVHSAQLIVQ